MALYFLVFALFAYGGLCLIRLAGVCLCWVLLAGAGLCKLLGLKISCVFAFNYVEYYWIFCRLLVCFDFCWLVLIFVSLCGSNWKDTNCLGENRVSM